jgi:hypothetical protein
MTNLNSVIKNLKQGTFPFIITLSALSVSVSAAFYSVTGLSKLFAGASTEVLIMASSLEISKLVIASLLYQYWDSINKVLRTYLTIACITLILITSAGIYGFLSSAYQETANKAGNIDAQVELLEKKRDNYKEQLTLYNAEKESINTSINNLRGGLSNNTSQYVDKKTGQLVITSSSANRKALEKQLDQAVVRQSSVNQKVDSLNTLVFDIETQIVEVQTNGELASELGPLKYLSNLTGVSMDRIINYLLLIIIFVFDPLAISLVIAANFAFAQLKGKDMVIENNTKEQQKEALVEMMKTDEEAGLYEEEIKQPEEKTYVKLPKDLKEAFQQTLKHQKRSGSTQMNSDELDRFFED